MDARRFGAVLLLIGVTPAMADVPPPIPTCGGGFSDNFSDRKPQIQTINSVEFSSDGDAIIVVVHGTTATAGWTMPELDLDYSDDGATAILDFRGCAPATPVAGGSTAVTASTTLPRSVKPRPRGNPFVNGINVYENEPSTALRQIIIRASTNAKQFAVDPLKGAITPRNP
jgi:hypothetical protein